MRRVLKFLVVLLAAAWLVSIVRVVLASQRDAAAPADAIVVLGAAQYNGRPSPVFKARLDHAADLFRKGLAPRLAVTGGVGYGDTVSEAAVGRRYLVAAGAGSMAVTAIGTGRSTEQSLSATAQWITAHGWRRVILVSDGFHMLRLCITASRLGLEPLGSPAMDSPIAANLRLQLGYIVAESFKAPLAYLVTKTR
jgi:uncharacterized SAM-binding protein YcdF (DUF218 family)